MKRYNDATSWPWEQAVQRTDALERQAPSRAPSVDADVLVPLQQALVCGIFGAVISAALSLLLTSDPWLFLALAGGGGVCIAAAAWWWLLLDHRRLLWETERATRTGMDEGAQPQELRVAISHYDEKGRFTRMEYLNIPGITQEQLQAFAREVCNGMPLAVAAWTGRGAVFSRGQYDTLMAELIRAGLVRDGSGNVGRVLTPAGRGILRKVAAA